MGKFIGGFVVGVIAVMAVGVYMTVKETKEQPQNDQPKDTDQENKPE